MGKKTSILIISLLSLFMIAQCISYVRADTTQTLTISNYYGGNVRVNVQSVGVLTVEAGKSLTTPVAAPGNYTFVVTKAIGNSTLNEGIIEIHAGHNSLVFGDAMSSTSVISGGSSNSAMTMGLSIGIPIAIVMLVVLLVYLKRKKATKGN